MLRGAWAWHEVVTKPANHELRHCVNAWVTTARAVEAMPMSHNNLATHTRSQGV